MLRIRFMNAFSVWIPNMSLKDWLRKSWRDKTTDHQQAMTNDVLVKPVLPVHTGHITGITCFTSRVRHQNNGTMDLYKLKAKNGFWPLVTPGTQEPLKQYTTAKQRFVKGVQYVFLLCTGKPTRHNKDLCLFLTEWPLTRVETCHLKLFFPLLRNHSHLRPVNHKQRVWI